MVGEITPGYRLGPYVFVAQIGRGGFAPVWVAEERWGESLLRSVAIKVFHFARAEPDGDSSWRARILDEARALCRVEHPNIVRFYAVATAPDQSMLGLVMEHLQGTPLDRQLAESSQLSLNDALAMGSAVASALAAAHEAGLVHRDVKPANVIDANGVWKLIDFGIASSAERAAPRSRRGVVVMDDLPLDVVGSRVSVVPGMDSSGLNTSGTMGYIDPAALSAPATPSSDLYSLGATVFQCLTGQLPAAAAARLAGQSGLAGDVLDGRRRSPSLAELMPNAPTRLVALLDSLLDPDPHKRPRAAEPVAWEFERIRREATGHGRQVPPEEVGPFRGLGRFEESDRDLYFGRAAEVAAVLEMLRCRSVVALVGASGSGKSSLARAGVLPAVRDGDLSGWPQAWTTTTIMPGADPWHALQRALDIDAADPDALMDALTTRVAETKRGVLLLIDQLEELVTISSVESRDVVVEFLARIATRATPGIKCLVTLRRDMLDRLLGLGAMGGTLTRGAGGPVFVAPMTRETWGEVIEQSLAAYGYKLEDEALRSELLEELRSVDAMPLVQFALTELWARRDVERKVLPRAALAEIGGVAGALEMHAERVRSELIKEDSEHGGALYAVVMAMTTPEGTRAVVREEALVEAHAKAARVIEALDHARLLLREGGTATIIHEALLTQWSRLRAWLEEARTDRLLVEELEREAAEWSRDGNEERLWRKRRLNAALQIAETGQERLSNAAGDFLRVARRAERRSWLILRAGGALVLAMIFGALAMHASDDVEEAKACVAAKSDFATCEKDKADAESQNESCRNTAKSLNDTAIANYSSGELCLERYAQLKDAGSACAREFNLGLSGVSAGASPPEYKPCGCASDDQTCLGNCKDWRESSFNDKRARSKIADAIDKLNQVCTPQQFPNDPSGGGQVEITFNPETGRPSTVRIYGPLIGTLRGSCISNHFETQVSVPMYHGSAQTIAQHFDAP